MHAAAFIGDIKMVRLLVAHGADIGAKVRDRLPEDVARDKGHKSIARLLGAKRRGRL